VTWTRTRTEAAIEYLFEFEEIEVECSGANVRSVVKGTARVKVAEGWEWVGTLTGSVLDRRCNNLGFHSACNDTSYSHDQELYEVALECCNVNGSTRFYNITELNAMTHGGSSRGLFLQIAEVS
jgi:hypothetical protein